jgi:histidinol phosphatase-like enzyme (inositol monophosphatase family)
MDPAFLAAAEAALAAAAPILRAAFRAPLAVDRKPDASPVTEADRAAERAMRAILADRLPNHGILGEEYGAELRESPWRWVLDPIDGTRAFITGRPLWGTLIALLHQGRPVLGILDQPVTGERWTGLANETTRFTSPYGGRIGTRPCASLAAAELACTSPEMFGPHLPAWMRLAAAAGRTSYGGDCQLYGLLALGQLDLVCEAGLRLWDWAALTPIVEGAGGRLTDWSGQTLAETSDGRVLAAGDPGLHARIVESGVLAAEAEEKQGGRSRPP